MFKVFIERGALDATRAISHTMRYSHSSDDKGSSYENHRSVVWLLSLVFTLESAEKPEPTCDLKV